MTPPDPSPTAATELEALVASGAGDGGLLPGERTGPYVIRRVLGEGGMGVVHLARDTRLNRLVAIKVLPPEDSGDAVRLQRFLREAPASSALNHPNIIPVYDVSPESEQPAYLVGR